MAEPRLSTADRELFGTLERIVYGNPFSDERAQLIQCLLPGFESAGLEEDREALARLVEPRLQPFSGVAGRDRLNAADRRLVEAGLLYVRYHRHVPSIDGLIVRATAGGNAVQPDRVASALIRDLVASGFAEPVATRYFAFFYQLRRAYHFIVRSLAGDCPSMQRLRRALWDNVFTRDMRRYEAGLWSRMEDFSTLLLGETGTGKGEAAAAIGRSEFIPYLPQERRFAADFAASFIALNLSQFPETLIESELFGHRKGAFTGAVENHVGVLERCNAHGALFLDEIGEVSIPVQIKLLQVLQERSFAPLSGHERKRFAGRVIAATHRPLGELRRAGRFRDDFYYRLCSDVIMVPPLRQRIEESPRELEQLVRLLVSRIAGADNTGLAAFVLEAIERDLPRGYAWPGNVRELEQAVRRILLTGRYAGDIAGNSAGDDERLAENLLAGRLSAEELLGRYCGLLYRQLGSYAEVAERTNLDRRTVRKYIAGQVGAGHDSGPRAP